MAPQSGAVTPTPPLPAPHPHCCPPPPTPPFPSIILCVSFAAAKLRGNFSGFNLADFKLTLMRRDEENYTGGERRSGRPPPPLVWRFIFTPLLHRSFVRITF